MADIFDIARLAGVSKSAVSRVINNQPGVKEEKRKAIQAVIDEYNYSPNAMARGLVTKKSHTFAIFIREIVNTFYGEYMRHLHYLADEEHFGTIFCQVNHDSVTNINYIDLLNKKVDGFVFVGEDTVNEREIQRLFKDEYPLVMVQNSIDDESVPHFKIDNYQAYKVATNYLVELGHENIVNIKGPNQYEFNQRNLGYESAIEENGLKSYTLSTDYFLKTASNLAKSKAEWFKKEKITAAVCSNNIIATGFIDGLISAGFNVPDDFSVIGFDDVVVAEYTDNYIPPITSMSQPQNIISEKVIESLLLQIEGKKQPTEPVIFQCELVKRKTTAKRTK